MRPGPFETRQKKAAHRNRWITGLIALPFLICLIYAGGTFFSVFIGLIAALGALEYFRISFNPEGSAASGLLLLLALAAGPAVIWAAHRNDAALVAGVFAVYLILSGLTTLCLLKSDPHALGNLSRQTAGVAYIPLLLSFLVMIRNGSGGAGWIFLLVAVVFAGDIGAFYAGNYRGRRKLCPSVSPGKTVEGSLGGLGANVLIGLIVKPWVAPSASWGLCILMFLLIGAAGQIGDLFESGLKRNAGVKDSGAILPGHGGVLDRIDAMLFAAPVAFLFKGYIL